MVTVIDRFNRAASAGSSLGQGLGQAAGTVANRLFERGQVKNALGNLDNLKGGSSAFDVAKALIEGTAGLPEQGRILQALYGPLIEQMRSQSRTDPRTEGATSEIEDMIENRPQNIQLPNFKVKQDGFNQIQRPGRSVKEDKFEGSPPTLSNLLPSIERKLGEKYFPNIETPESTEQSESFRPLKPPVKPLPISVKEKDKIRKILQKSGVTDKKTQDDYINETIQYQNDLFDAQQSGYKSTTEYQKARQAEDERFFTDMAPNLQNLNLTPESMNIWKGFSRLSENSGSDDVRYANTNAMFNELVHNPLVQFDDTAKPLPFASALRPEHVKNSLEEDRSTIQEHLKKIDGREDLNPRFKGEIKNYLRDAYSTSMAGKDWGTAQQAYAVSNLSKDFSSKMPHVPPEAFVGKEWPMFKRKENIYKLSNHLLKNLKPEDSLLLARERAIQENYNDEAFNQALDIATKNGLILSDFQTRERPKLGVPQRLDLDSIMRGKRSVFEIFKAKK